MLEAMIKKKGEDPPGLLEGRELDRGLEQALQNLQPVLLGGLGGKAGQPTVRKARPGLRAWATRTVACRSIVPGWFALNCVFLLETCSWSWGCLWAQRAVLPRDKIVPGMVKRALDWESGDLGLILVPPVTYFAWIPGPALVLAG